MKENICEQKLRTLAEQSSITASSSSNIIYELDETVKSEHLDIAFRWAAHFLCEPPISEDIWDWLVKKSLDADLKLRCALTVGVFELLVDDPKWSFKLLSLLQNRKLWWIVIDVYENKPEKLYADLALHAESFSGATR